MDKPTTPNGPNAPPWPEESGSDQGFGATGVFQVVQADKKPEPASGPGTEPWFQEYRAPEAAKPIPPPTPKPLAEPVVHKVVLGAGAESSPELLDRMRLASAERTALAEKPSAPASGGQGSGGFTELLRTLESDLTSPAPPTRETPAPARPAQESGFTSLLRTLNEPELAPAPAESPVKTVQLPPQFARTIPEEPVRAPAPAAPGGFTQLLQTTTGGDSEMSTPPSFRPVPGETPAFGGPAGTSPAPAENKPGAFTQLFSSLGGSETSAPVPAATDRAAGDSSRGNAGSFTRMLSLEPQSAAAEPAFQEERKPLPGSVNYGLTPGTAAPAAASRDPFAPAPVVESKPADSAPPGGSVGITRLIQMLDEPSKPAVPRIEPAPVSAPRGTEPGVWTQTFASLSTPNAPAAQPAPTVPSWSSPPLAPAAPTGRDAQFPGSMNEPVVHPAAAAGPSEFTRILDASRMRELAMRGGSGAANLPQTPVPQAPAPLPPPPIGGMQGMGAVPHPGVYPPPPPQAPTYPMSYGSPGGAMPAPGGSMPQAPGMYAPAPPPMPAPPPPPPPKPAEPGVGKLQQLVPMLLVVVIVLLVVLIVTVIFLMKH